MKEYHLDHPDKFDALPSWWLNDEAQFMELEAEVDERRRQQAAAGNGQAPV